MTDKYILNSSQQHKNIKGIWLHKCLDKSRQPQKLELSPSNNDHTMSKLILSGRYYQGGFIGTREKTIRAEIVEKNPDLDNNSSTLVAIYCTAIKGLKRESHPHSVL